MIATRKYIEIAKISFKEQMAYNFNNAFRIVLSVFRIIMAVILWSVIFRDKTLIGGFTLGMMVTYYIFISFLKGFDASDMALLTLSTEIREGKFTKYLVKPVRPLLYFISSCISKSFYYLLFNLLAMFVFILVFGKYFTLTHDMLSLMFATLLFISGSLFLILLNYFIAIFSFKFMDVETFSILKGVLTEFLTGMLIPLALFPEIVQKIMSFFPFYHIYYYPAMILVGAVNSGFIISFVTISIWNASLLILINIAYPVLVKKYDGAGI